MSVMSVLSTPLPVDETLPALSAALARGRNAVLQAPPGAGKTTRVLLALLTAPWLQGRRSVMLEPRRIAARAAAHYMAAQLGEQTGETVGYPCARDSRVSARTRIEVVTEGVLTRRLQDDPGLDDVGLVIFDEFHERNLQADLGLALCLEIQGALRDDVRLLVMSATLDGAPVAHLLGGAPLITSKGRSYPVDTRYLPDDARHHSSGPQAAHVATVLRRVLAEEEGSVLVFLPGVADIKRVERLLQENAVPADVTVAPLYGDLSIDAQERAIRPVPAGRRKVVLATAIAETSLTIEGVRVVVDSGWARAPRFDPVSGMTRLVTTRVSRASADQRRGRAGRLGPGVCYRLWSEGEHDRLAEFNRPEITEADLAPLALELAQWGGGDPAALSWLAAPRGERDVLIGVRASDVHLRLVALRGEPVAGTDRAALARVRKAAEHYRRLLGVGAAAARDSDGAGLLLAYAYPDRIAQRRPGSEPRYRLANGRGAYFAEHEPLSGEPYIVAAELDGAAREARSFLAAALTAAEIEDRCADLITQRDFVAWDAKSESVQARRQRRLGELIFADAPLPAPDPAAVTAALLAGIRTHSLDALPWTDGLRRWCERVAFLRRVAGPAWPDVGDAALLAQLEDWLAPYLLHCSRRSHLAGVDLAAALGGLLTWEQQRELDTLAPTHLAVPSGDTLRCRRRVRVLV